MSQRSDGYHAALASAPRRRVLDALAQAVAPLDAATVADLLHLHVTTARFHLDQLVTAGLAHRRLGTERRRGRPRVLYAFAGAARDDDSREQLIDVLAATLADQRDSVREAELAGRRWAEQVDTANASSPEDGMIAAFERLGFEPERQAARPTGDRVIELRACPFRAAAREHPEVVCSVHRGLIEGLMQNGEGRAELIPLVEPELCLVTLARPA
jgi:predicted ArsR family transcriptional regulator